MPRMAVGGAFVAFLGVFSIMAPNEFEFGHQTSYKNNFSFEMVGRYLYILVFVLMGHRNSKLMKCLVFQVKNSVEN